MADKCNLLVFEDSVVENPLSCEENSIYYDVEIFIQEIQKLECLWNTSLASYKDKNCKVNAWQQLSKLFGKDVCFQCPSTFIGLKIKYVCIDM